MSCVAMICWNISLFFGFPRLYSPCMSLYSYHLIEILTQYQYLKSCWDGQDFAIWQLHITLASLLPTSWHHYHPLFWKLGWGRLFLNYWLHWLQVHLRRISFYPKGPEKGNLTPSVSVGPTSARSARGKGPDREMITFVQVEERGISWGKCFVVAAIVWKRQIWDTQLISNL